jgi:holo-[acyl-carrier protein] synthase
VPHRPPILPPPPLPAGAVLLGIGCDVIEVERVRRAIERHGERFLLRVFTDEERAYCAGLASPFRHYAARFAAKEAISKAFTTGIGEAFGWRSAGVRHGERHEPLVELDQQGRALLEAWGGTDILLSLSHGDTVAMAVAAIVRAPRASG